MLDHWISVSLFINGFKTPANKPFVVAYAKIPIKIKVTRAFVSPCANLTKLLLLQPSAIIIPAPNNKPPKIIEK